MIIMVVQKILTINTIAYKSSYDVNNSNLNLGFSVALPEIETIGSKNHEKRLRKINVMIWHNSVVEENF